MQYLRQWETRPTDRNSLPSYDIKVWMDGHMCLSSCVTVELYKLCKCMLFAHLVC